MTEVLRRRKACAVEWEEVEVDSGKTPRPWLTLKSLLLDSLVVVCCSVLQCVVAICLLQCVAVSVAMSRHRAFGPHSNLVCWILSSWHVVVCFAVCCSVLLYVAVCLLQCVAVRVAMPSGVPTTSNLSCWVFLSFFLALALTLTLALTRARVVSCSNLMCSISLL